MLWIFAKLGQVQGSQNHTPVWVQLSFNGGEKFPTKNGAEFEFLYLVRWSKVLSIPIWKGCPKASYLMPRYFSRSAACSAFIFVYRSSNIYTEIYITPVVYVDEGISKPNRPAKPAPPKPPVVYE